MKRTAVCLVLIVLLLAGCSTSTPSYSGTGSASINVTVVVKNGDDTVVSTPVTVRDDAPTAMMAVTAALDFHKVAYEDKGGYLDGIAGAMGNDMHGWLYDVNGDSPIVGMAEYSIADGDVITLSYVDYASMDW